jgi:mRNA interferase RelE/StbE
VCSADDLPFEFWHLFSFWEPEPQRAVLHQRVQTKDLRVNDVSEVLYDYLDIARYKGPPPWRIGFSSQFRKDVGALDRKLQGRILEVLQEISDYAVPFRTKGDTFKPLKGDLMGYWRYRIGDFRLVIKPIVAKSEIDVITFSARGAVYE